MVNEGNKVVDRDLMRDSIHEQDVLVAVSFLNLAEPIGASLHALFGHRIVVVHPMIRAHRRYVADSEELDEREARGWGAGWCALDEAVQRE